MVGEGINKAKKGDKMNKEEPDALKGSQIVSIKIVFRQVDHFALDNILYDAKNNRGLKEVSGGER
jgi:hypothetical protein